MKTVIVLDQRTSKVHIYQNVLSEDADAETFITNLEYPTHRLSECSWMVVDKLELIIETE